MELSQTTQAEGDKSLTLSKSTSLFNRRNKVEPAPSLIYEGSGGNGNSPPLHLNPILCVPACDMKFSGISTSRPRHCPPFQIELLRQIAGLSTTSSIGIRDNINCRWSLQGHTHQLLFDGRGLQILQSKVISCKGSGWLWFSPLQMFSLFRKKSAELVPPPHVDFKVEVKDADDCTVITLSCKRFWFDVPKICEIDEMEVFLGKYELPVGKLIRLPQSIQKATGKADYYSVYDEKGQLVYSVQSINNAPTESSRDLNSYVIRKYGADPNSPEESTNVVGEIKYWKRRVGHFLAKYWFGYGPSLICFDDNELPITHKCLLIGTLFFIMERASSRTEPIRKEIPSSFNSLNILQS